MPGTRSGSRLQPVAQGFLVALLAAAPAAAYIGPGAGFALMSSFLVLLATVALAFLSLLAWPVRTLWRVVRRKKPPKAHVRRLVFVGLDGQDPRLTERMMKEGKLPNFQRLSDRGSYRRIASTYPALSPVAWSTFATGANPGKHNIFDFLDRDLRSYLPKLSSAHIGRVERFLRSSGKWKIPAPEAGDPHAAALQAVLDRARRAERLEHRAAGADHLPAGPLLRRATRRDVRAGPGGQPGHLPALHDASRRRRRSGRAACGCRCPRTVPAPIVSTAWSKGRRTASWRAIRRLLSARR